MTFRNVYGNDWSEAGWRMCNRDECDIVHIPGLTLVDTAPLRKGPPLIILGAWLFWYDRNVEEIVTPVWGWTETNAVGDSNHLAGAAVDINAPQYPWGSRVMPGDRIAKIRAGQRLFEDTVFWGEDWNRADQMHHQMHWEESDSRNQAFANKLLGGYLGIYGQPAPPSRTDGYALAVIVEGHKRHISPRGIQIALTVPPVESGWKIYSNSNVPDSLGYPHDAVGSDHDSTGLFQQRQAWGPLSCTMDPACSAGLFYDGGAAGQRGLTDFNYDDMSRSPGSIAQSVQVSAFPDRYDQHWGEAVELYNRLAGTPPPPPPQEGFLMALSDAEQREVLNSARITAAQRHSRSPFRELDEGDVGDAPDQIWDIDSSVHILVVFLMATLGEPGQLAKLNRIANADPARYPDRQADRLLAQAVLAEVADNDALKAGILAALGRVTVNVPAVVTGEVLPAVVQPRSNTPQDLLDTLDKLKTFDDGYRQRFNSLIEKEITP